MTMTRGEFALRLAQHLELPMENSGGFSDTAGQYDKAIRALKDAGIVTGTGASAFSPHQNVTREQAATMFGRAYDIKGASGTASFSDVDTNHYSSDYISGLKEAGIFKGYEDGTFGGSADFDERHFNRLSIALTEYESTQSTPTTPSAGTPDTGATIGTPSIPGTPGTTPPGESPAIDEDAWEWAASYLEEHFDLADMLPWVIEMVELHGNNLSQSIIDIEIHDTTQFDDRYGDVMRGRAADGLVAISAMDILDFERAARSTMKASGLPPGFYDDQADFHAMLIADVSLVQLQDRIATGFERVSQAPLEIRQAYADFYGPMGDEALASFLLDPDKSQPALERAVTNAEISGTGQQFGASISQARADELAGNGVDRNMAFTGFTRLAAMGDLFEETVGETDDLTIEEEGVDSQFLGQASATRSLQRRGQSRTSAFSGGGGAATSAEGVFGAGTAT